MIYVEKSALNLPLTDLVMSLNAGIKIIDDGEEVEDKKTNIVLTARKDNFVHPCPGTNIYKCCNYHVADIMQGCPFDCSYCILQAYLPHKHIRVSADWHSIASDVKNAAKYKKRRIGTGELADSLALDHIVPLSCLLVPIANAYDNIQFEFKTKSAQISNLLNMDPKNVVVSWSLNPQEIILREEPLTAPLKKRLEAAKTVADYGYKVGFHFDPMVYCNNFESLYGELIEELVSIIPEDSVEFISISTFRCPPELLHSMRSRPKESMILQGDFIKGLDGKVRYFKTIRATMLKFALDNIRRHWKKPFIYFCMEHESLWEKFMGFDPKDRESFESQFPFYG